MQTYPLSVCYYSVEESLPSASAPPNFAMPYSDHTRNQSARHTALCALHTALVDLKGVSSYPNRRPQAAVFASQRPQSRFTSRSFCPLPRFLSWALQQHPSHRILPAARFGPMAEVPLEFAPAWHMRNRWLPPVVTHHDLLPKPHVHTTNLPTPLFCIFPAWPYP